MLEKELERKCLKLAKERGALMPKWVSPGNAGVPDRILLLPGRVVFLEFKTATGWLSPRQVYWAAALHKFGLSCEVIRSVAEFEALFDA